ncbi:putative small multi-drug export [Abeliophyllum distichum]|uniref:Small multi-drug export n=1 Tax=Abeliophyllum distichum TaxID=126358 RepID=A0ABD1U348_9LAMI
MIHIFHTTAAATTTPTTAVATAAAATTSTTAAAASTSSAAASSASSAAIVTWKSIILGWASSIDFLESTDKNEEKSLLGSKEKPMKFLFWVLLWASVSLGLYAFSGDAKAATDSIRASGFGVKVANALRASGWPDEAVVFALATLPVIELRGAIPVGYWLQLKPVILTVLSILGNMVPVPFIVLYLKPFATFLAAKNQAASKFLDVLFEKAKEKAGPVEEFQWLGLMLFVAVPFPGTGAWTGAFIASILDMPFWSAVSANFLGVVLAGLLVNLLVNLGLKYATVTGIILFIISTFMWSILRYLKKSLSASN